MLTIRKAEITDTALLSEMGYASYRHHFAHLWREPAELEAFLRQQYASSAIQQSLQGEADGWFIAQDVAPVGFAKVTWHSAVDEHGPSGTLLHKLYLLPGETRKGYGEQLLAEIERLVQQRGETFIWLEVLDANPNAKRFYLRQGFTHLKDTQFCTASQQSTLHILGKPL
ncbi:GNAT family N-acetyltransferase [Kosakonia quasisacchari]|uniref:GNAT family N-acetyltransferase n=1 Tax=Kosakonia quasisacchari TaxID=2529380 RepID=UPI0039DF41D5